MEQIPGVLLIISCHKHLNTRIPELGLKEDAYFGWKVIKVVGNPFISPVFEYNYATNILTIRCEDSYLHLMKKVVLAISVCFELFDIQEGILRCGDDVVFDEGKLGSFLQFAPKHPYMGKIAWPSLDPCFVGKKHYNPFMMNYFYAHMSDVYSPINGLRHIPMKQLFSLHYFPLVSYAGGVVVFLSTSACRALMDEMESIDFDIFHYNEEAGYPYIVEDIGIGYTLLKKGILPIQWNLYADSVEELLQSSSAVALHTNKYK